MYNVKGREFVFDSKGNTVLEILKMSKESVVRVLESKVRKREVNPWKDRLIFWKLERGIRPKKVPYELVFYDKLSV